MVSTQLCANRELILCALATYFSGKTRVAQNKCTRQEKMLERSAGRDAMISVARKARFRRGLPGKHGAVAKW